MGNQCDITDEFEKLSISPEEKQSDDARSMLLLFKPKVLNAINNIRESKKRPDNDSILDYIIKTEASNVDKTLIISITNELINQNLIENKKTRQGLDSLHLVELSDEGNILNNFVDITPSFDTSTTEVLQLLHPEAVENASPDPFYKYRDINVKIH